MSNIKSSGASPFGRFEWMVSRRYLGATRTGGGVSLISIIAFAGIGLSVATMIVVMSVFQGFRINLLDQLLSVNGHMFVTNAYEPLTDYEERKDRLLQVPGVNRATPVLRVDAYAVGPGDQGAARINGINKKDLLLIEEVTQGNHLVSGNFDTFGEGNNGGNEIAVGRRLAYILGVGVGDVVTLATAGGAETPFGRTAFTQKKYKVGAIFQIGNSTFDQYYIYMPLEQAQLLARKPGAVTEIEVRVDRPIDIEPYIVPVQQAGGEGAIVQDWRQRSSDIFQAVQVEGGLMRIIMMMIIAVATVNIISGLVMLVKDKRSDIAILRTMGTTQGAIMRIFVMVGGTIGVSGAIAGVGLGVLVASNLTAIEGVLSALFGFRVFNPAIYFLEEIPSVIEWHEVSMVVMFTLVMSLLSSAYPAWRASKVDPVEALRYE